mgnify:CR=1 FL=1
MKALKEKNHMRADNKKFFGFQVQSFTLTYLLVQLAFKIPF